MNLIQLITDLSCAVLGKNNDFAGKLSTVHKNLMAYLKQRSLQSLPVFPSL